MGTAPPDLAEQFARLAASQYNGWVAWVDQGSMAWTPIYEARPANPGLVQVGQGARPEEEATRGKDFQTMDWRDVCKAPDLMRRIQILAVFGFYGLYDFQPLAVVQRNSPGAWFLNYKERGLQIFHGDGPGQQRTPISWYRIGFWERELTKPMWSIAEVTPEKRGTITRPGRPWAPSPEGLGLDPALCGVGQETYKEV